MAHDVAVLAEELTAMAAAAHQASVHAKSDDPAERLAWRRLTARHGDRLNEIMDEYGWPTADLVGEEAARAAWLIAQHADRQLNVQRRALHLMQQAVSAGAADPRELRAELGIEPFNAYVAWAFGGCRTSPTRLNCASEQAWGGWPRPWQRRR